MTYTIQKTNGDTLVSINDTEKNTTYGVTLIGRNYSGYGLFLNDNFIALMENFASATSPGTPLAGQLWYDTNSKNINIYTGNGFKALAYLTSSASQPNPGPTKTGDLWWDTTNQQLKAFTSSNFVKTSAMTVANTTELRLNNTDDLQVGDQLSSSGGSITLSIPTRIEQIISASNVRITNSATVLINETITVYRGTGWNVVGPQYSITQGKTVVEGKTIIDTDAVAHSVAVGYVKDQAVFTVSRDSDFVPRPADAITGFPTIRTGITMQSGQGKQFPKTISGQVGYEASTGVATVTGSGYAVNDRLILTDSYGTCTAVVATISGGGPTGPIATVNFYGTGADRGFFTIVPPAPIVADNTDASGVGAEIEITMRPAAYYGVDPATNVSQGRTVVPLSSVDDLGLGDTIISANNTPSSNRTIIDIFLSNSSVLVNVGDIFTPAEHVTFQRGVIQPYLLHGTASDSQRLDGASPDLYARRDRNTFFDKDVTLNYGNLFVTNLAITDSKNGDIEFYNRWTGGDMSLSIDDPDNGGRKIRAIYINGTPGFGANVEVNVDPTTPMGIATKHYVDTANAAVTLNLLTNVDTLIGPSAPTGRRSFSGISALANTIIATADALAADEALKAYTLNPRFQGEPWGTTAPFNLLDRSKTTSNLWLATTEFVDNAIYYLKEYNDANASVQHDQIYLRAFNDSPVLTGTPKAPNPDVTDRFESPPGSSRIATTAYTASLIDILTAYVNNQLSLKADLDSPVLTGVPEAPTLPYLAQTPQIATVAHVFNGLALKANIAGATFTGDVFVPKAPDLDSSGRVASTAWVQTAFNTASVNYWGGSFKFISTRAPLSTDGNDGDLWFQYTP